MCGTLIGRTLLCAASSSNTACRRRSAGSCPSRNGPALAAPCLQFERFRRIFYTPYYVTLLNLSAWEVTSSLEVSDRLWVARVHVDNSYRKVSGGGVGGRGGLGARRSKLPVQLRAPKSTGLAGAPSAAAPGVSGCPGRAVQRWTLS